MQSAIAYARVSTEHQGRSGIGLDAQMAQIKQFAADSGFHIEVSVREIASATGPGSIKNRPKLVRAVSLSRKKGWPIIVASFDRLSRNTAELERLAREGALDVYVANIGGQVGYLAMRSGVARAEHEARETKNRAAIGRAAAKKRGVKFGNPVTLPEAQRKGAATNKEKAKQRGLDLESAILEAQLLGARTAQQIADAFNERGLKTSTGRKWTEGNLHTARRRKRLRDPKPGDESAAPIASLNTIADAKLSSEWLEIMRSALIARGNKASSIDKLISGWERREFPAAQLRQLDQVFANHLQSRADARAGTTARAQEAILGSDHKLTGAGLERVRLAMIAKGKKPDWIDRAIHQLAAQVLDEKQSERLAVWVVDAAARNG